MVTLMTIGNSEGDRRCDARCYGAKYSTCVCCCGGINHIKGKAQAVQNTKDIANKVLENCTLPGTIIKPIQETLGGIFNEMSSV